MDKRNGYMLEGRLARRGYDWWWHSLVAVNERSGEREPFFIEYFVMNPALGGSTAIPGQLPENKRSGVRPAYAMIKAGRWGREGRSAQIHNFYAIDDFEAARDRMEVRIGEGFASETRLSGSVSLSEEEASAHPEYMSDSGRMSWELEAEKILPFSVGYGTNAFFRRIKAFQMYWHAAGMKTRYRGRITFNGEAYRVEPETSCGYQDKNWGSDYTSPWIWLNCNSFTDRATGKTLGLTSLDVGGAGPVVFGIPLPRRLLIAFYLEGKLYEWNFAKFWRGSRQLFGCPEYPDRVEWNVDAWDRKWKVEIRFSCPRDSMIKVNYENPDGEKRHNRLWNGGYASGTIRLFERRGREWAEVGCYDGELGGCEYGEYDR
jgi:hypothetical protein